jgi:hypothetical protein
VSSFLSFYHDRLVNGIPFLSYSTSSQIHVGRGMFSFGGGKRLGPREESILGKHGSSRGVWSGMTRTSW